MKCGKKEKKLTKELRMLGLSHEAAAKLIGVDKMTVSKWVNTDTRISPVNVTKLKEIGVPLDAIRNPGSYA